MLGYAPASWMRLSRSASIVPSRRPPIRKSIRCARPWGSAIRFSVRVSVQRTGLPRLAGQIGHEHVLAGQALAAEAAADVGGEHPDLPRIDVEDRRQPVAVLVRRLRRQPHRQAVVVLHARRRRSRLDRARRDPLARDRPGGDHLAAVEQLLVGRRRLALDAHVRADVLEQQHLVLQRLERIGHDRQRLVVDLDQLGGVDASLLARSQHRGDDLAREPDLVGRQEHLVPAIVDSQETAAAPPSRARCPAP